MAVVRIPSPQERLSASTDTISMEYRPISVITSKVAQNHLDEIRVRHNDMLKGMSEQSMKLQNMNQQKATEQANKQASDREYAFKQQELATKSYGFTH